MVMILGRQHYCLLAKDKGTLKKKNKKKRKKKKKTHCENATASTQNLI
jgi:hypothetical protein